VAWRAALQLEKPGVFEKVGHEDFDHSKHIWISARSFDPRDASSQ